jgi:hypothetical protein
VALEFIQHQLPNIGDRLLGDLRINPDVVTMI